MQAGEHLAVGLNESVPLGTEGNQNIKQSEIFPLLSTPGLHHLYSREKPTHNRFSSAVGEKVKWERDGDALDLAVKL